MYSVFPTSALHGRFPPSKQKCTKKISPPFACKNTLQVDPPAYSKPTPIPPFDPSSVPPPALNPFQKVVAAVLDKVEHTVVHLERKQPLNRMVDPAVQLEGNYAPVLEFPVQHNLEVIGTIPKSVHGVYLRNGGNPLFSPVSGHHFFDGDGMIHAVSFGEENQASYACRLTKTNRLNQEAALGKPVFPKPIGELRGHLGLARLALFGARSLAGVVDGLGGIGVANAGLIYFNGRLLAISEDDLPYHVRITKDRDLMTVGQWDFDEQLKDALIAHPKVDPDTGDLYSLSYNVMFKPHLKLFKFDRWGNKEREVPIFLQEPTMIHDFAMTENYIVIPDHQVVFKLCEMVQGRSPVVHNPKKVTRFGVCLKDVTDESMIQWIDVPGWFGFHIWNAWEENTEDGDKIIVVINSCMSPAESMFSGGDEPLKSELSVVRLNLNTGESSRNVVVAGMNLEAGMMNKKLLGKKNKYLYLAIADPFPKCHGVAKIDLETGHIMKYMFGGRKYGGEPCFVPRDEDVEEEDGEDEGYVMSFVRDEEMETSELVMLKTSTMEVVATVKLPSRVPYGFHGTFVSDKELIKQYLL